MSPCTPVSVPAKITRKGVFYRKHHQVNGSRQICFARCIMGTCERREIQCRIHGKCKQWSSCWSWNFPAAGKQTKLNLIGRIRHVTHLRANSVHLATVPLLWCFDSNWGYVDDLPQFWFDTRNWPRIDLQPLKFNSSKLHLWRFGDRVLQVSKMSQNNRSPHQAENLFKITRKSFQVIILIEIRFISLKEPT